MKQVKYNRTWINLILGLFLLVASTHTSLMSQCVIEEVYAEAHTCDDGSVLIDVEFYSAGVETFSIVANGVSYGEYSVGEVFYTFGPVEAICDELTQITILSSNGPECAGEFVFDEPLCCEDECGIATISTTDIICDEDGNVTFLLDFDAIGFENDFFDLLAGDTLYGFYALEDLPVSITFPNSEDDVIFGIAENDNSDCSSVFVFNPPNCFIDFCTIYNIEGGYLDCESPEEVYIELSFDYSLGLGDSFTASIGDQLLGEYSFGMGSYLLGPLEANCNEELSLIITPANEDSCEVQALFLPIPPCCEVEGGCYIFDVVAEGYDCDENNTTFFVDIAFEYTGDPGEVFSIIGDGNNYGTFEFGQPHYTIGPLESNCYFDYEFSILPEQDNCESDFAGLLSPCCEDDEEGCSINELEYFDFFCSDDGNFFTLWINFEPVNTTNDFYDVYVGGEYFETFLYSDLPQILEGIEMDDAIYTTITVCDNDNLEECCTSIDLVTNCETDEQDCYIFDVVAEGYECHEGNALFFVDIAFEYTGDPGDVFSIVGNGNEYGTFEFGQEYYTIGPIESSCDLDYEFGIITELDNCETEFTGLLSPCCEDDEDECSIGGIEYFDFFCSDDGNFFTLWIDFDPVNTTNEFYDVYVGGDYWDSYLYDDLPQILEGIQIFDETTLITVCDNDNLEECCSIVEVEANCETDESDCYIFDVIAEGYECDNDNTTFLVDIAFEYTGDPGEVFYVIGNGTEYGVFEFGQEYYTIGPIESECYLDYEFIIITEQDNCESDFAGLASPCCDDEVDGCSINDLEYFDYECSDDLEFMTLWINFEPINATNDFYDVYLNDLYFGSYLYADLPQIIEGIEVNDEYSLLTVCDNDNPNECCATVEIPTDCNDATGTDDENDCPEWEVLIQDNDNNTTIEVLSGEFDGTYTIEINGDLQGMYDYGGSVILVLTPGMDNTITITDSENEECSLTLTVESEPISSVDTERINAINLQTINGSIIATNDADFDLSVYGVDGRRIYTSTYPASQQRVDHLVSGLYIVGLERNGVRVMRMVYVY